MVNTFVCRAVLSHLWIEIQTKSAYFFLPEPPHPPPKKNKTKKKKKKKKNTFITFVSEFLYVLKNAVYRTILSPPWTEILTNIGYFFLPVENLRNLLSVNLDFCICSIPSVYRDIDAYFNFFYAEKNIDFVSKWYLHLIQRGPKIMDNVIYHTWGIEQNRIAPQHP